MQVTVIVLNYNYARFLNQAIDSALAQTHPSCEVVVVDNGSTDDSVAIAQGYGTRIRLVQQAVNIGQGQGYNLGFAAARGEWLIWLDADDLLDPDAIRQCLAAATPETSKVQFPLRLVDGAARLLGGEVPFLRHQGDVRPIIQRFGHYAGPPGSGNLYRRSAIAPYFPVPPEDWPICTDTVPFVTAPFHGLVVDTGCALGSYRLHGKSSPEAPGYTGNYSTGIAAEVRLNALSRDRSLALLRKHSGIDVAGPFLTLPPHVRSRIISWRLAPAAHPYPEDTATALWQLLSQSIKACPGYSVAHRWLMLGWAAGVLYGPPSVAQRLMASKRSSLQGTPLAWLASSLPNAAPLRWARRLSAWLRARHPGAHRHP